MSQRSSTASVATRKVVVATTPSRDGEHTAPFTRDRNRRCPSATCSRAAECPGNRTAFLCRYRPNGSYHSALVAHFPPDA